MASSTSQSNDGRLLEWPFPMVGRGTIANRNVGCASTMNIQFTFQNPSCLDMDRLRRRVVQVQEHWPLLSIAIAGQRTTQPKLQYRYSVWDTDRILVTDTYEPNPDDPKAERNAVHDRAQRAFQSKVSFEQVPLWGVAVFFASSDTENQRVYLAFLIDHVIIDGRGAVMLANSLVAKDISHLPKEDISLYQKFGLGQDNDQLPPYSYIASSMVKSAAFSALPGFVQRWLGQYPVWPERIQQPTIDSPWKSSILDISNDIVGKLKPVGKRHGIASLNAILHTAWMVTLWALFLRPERDRPQTIWDCSLKDLRDTSKGDPYCVGGHVTVYLWSPGLLTDATSFWALAKSYEAVSVNPQSYLDATKMMRMMNLFKDGPIDPDQSKHRVPDSPELPVGDKRAYTKMSEGSLAKMNSLTPYGNISGVWSNLSFSPLPEGTIDMVLGLSGSACGSAFNTIVVGHEKGTIVQNSYSDGAAMREQDVKKAEKLFVSILEQLGMEQDKNWVISDFLQVPRAKL